jgi:hypothetical protein
MSGTLKCALCCKFTHCSAGHIRSSIVPVEMFTFFSLAFLNGCVSVQNLVKKFLSGINYLQWLPMMLKCFVRVIVLSDGGGPPPEYPSWNCFFGLQQDFSPLPQVQDSHSATPLKPTQLLKWLILYLVNLSVSMSKNLSTL